MALPQQVKEELLSRGLLIAALEGDLPNMKEFAMRLDHGQGLLEIYSNYRGPEGQTALHYGAEGGRRNICKYLIEVLGLDVNIQDWKGHTALNDATLSCSHQTVAYLIRKGANVIPNHEGYTPVHTAAHHGLKETLQLLISNGGDVEALCKTATPLCTAASQGKKEAVEVLLDNNANPNATSFNAFSPLMLSIAAGSHECINLLLKAGADPDLGVNGVTPLERAVCKKNTEAIKCLLKAGANPNVANFEGMTPLEISAINHYHEGMTPLEISALNHYHEGVKVLLPKTNPIPSIRDWTPRGIINAVHSQEAKFKREQKKKDNFMESKTKGAEAFKKKDYFGALHWYNMAIYCDPLEETMFSNRSLCYACLDNGTKALADAEACIKLKPDWSEAYFRKGVACEILKDFRGATGAYVRALKLEPGNVEIETALRKVIELLKASMD